MIRKVACPGLILILLLLKSCAAPDYEVYVSPEGNDAAAGTLSAPVQSLHRAAALAAEQAGKVPVTVNLSGGVYSLDRPLKLGPENDGSKDAPVRWEAIPGEEVVISGGIRVDEWKQEEDGSWSALLPVAYKGRFRSFYVNGKRASRARHPDGEGYMRVAKAGEDLRTNFHFNEGDIPGLENTEGIELVLLHDWSVTRIPVRSIDYRKKQLTAADSIGAQLPFFTLTYWEEHPRYYLENAYEFCDQPGEWYGDFKARKIYYRPFPEEKIDETSGVIPIAGKLIEIAGSKEELAGHISFKGITFEHTAFELPGHGYCGIQACMFSDRGAEQNGWSKVPAAIELSLAEHCSFEQCTIRNTGGSGIWIGANCSGCEISKSHIHHVSGNGVNIGEGNDRLYEGDPWWKSVPEEVSRNNVVSHSLIEQCGLQFHGAVGIWCGLVANTLIEHNEIRDLPYSGISVGWLWTSEPSPCRENILHANHIHHILNILSDGGGIYSLGLQPGSRITQNLIHDVRVNAGRAESNGMFLDEGTRELLVENNIVYNIARSPLRFHKAQSPNMVRNNVLVCNEDIPPISYNNTREEDIQKIGNTVLSLASESDRLRLEYLLNAWFQDP